MPIRAAIDLGQRFRLVEQPEWSWKGRGFARRSLLEQSGAARSAFGTVIVLHTQAIHLRAAKPRLQPFQQGANGLLSVTGIVKQGQAAPRQRDDMGHLQLQRLDRRREQKEPQTLAQHAFETRFIRIRRSKLQGQRRLALPMQQTQSNVTYPRLPDRQPADQRRSQASCSKQQRARVFHGNR